MKVEIEEFNRGYVVTYSDKEGVFEYVFKYDEDLYMVEEIVKRFLKRKIKALEQ